MTLTVTDSFGVVTALGPASRETDGTAEWRLFTLSGLEDKGRGQDGRFLFVPHVAGEVTDNDLVEDVRFLRDEDANLVWAVEMAWRRPDGTMVRNGDSAADPAPPAVPNAAAGTTGRFRLQTDTPAHWTPYVLRVERPQAQGIDGAAGCTASLRAPTGVLFTGPRGWSR